MHAPSTGSTATAALADIVLNALTVNGDTHGDRCLAILEQLCLLKKEGHSEMVLLLIAKIFCFEVDDAMEQFEHIY